MIRKIEYTAERNTSLDIDDLERFVTDAKKIGMSIYSCPTITIRPDRYNGTTGTVQKISTRTH